MDNLSIFLFAIAGISTLVGAFYLMHSVANSKPVQDYNWHPMVDGGPESPEFKKYMRKVTKRVHPEMQDVEPGEQLLGEKRMVLIYHYEPALQTGFSTTKTTIYDLTGKNPPSFQFNISKVKFDGENRVFAWHPKSGFIRID